MHHLPWFCQAAWPLHRLLRNARKKALQRKKVPAGANEIVAAAPTFVACRSSVCVAAGAIDRRLSPGGVGDISSRLMGQWLSDRLGQPFEQVGDPWHVNTDVRDILRSPRRRAGAVAANLHLHMFTCSNRVSSTTLASVHHQPKKKLPIQARLIARRVHKPMKAPRCCVRPGTVSLTGWFIADPKEGPRRSRVEKSRPAGDRRPAAKKRTKLIWVPQVSN